MNSIGAKIKEVFSSVAVYKDPKNYEVFNGRVLPSFIKDFLVAQHIEPDGSLDRERLERFLVTHIPSDGQEVRSRLMRGEEMTLLTRFVVSTDLANNAVHFAIPDMGLHDSETIIPLYIVREYPNDLIDGEKWGIMKIVYIPPSDDSRGYVEMVAFRPFRPMENMDLDLFRQNRERFTLDEWIDVLLSAMEYEPDAFADKTAKMEFVSRLLPFVEPRLNLIELAPKGTGKSYVFGNLSKFVWLVSGGKVSRAKLVYDKSQQRPGIMRFYDLVAFDEIQTITFSSTSEMQSFLKAYLENGSSTIDNYEFMSQCGLMLLGNIELSSSGYPISDQYFDEMPELFRDAALLDRFHGMLEGWLMPRINSDMVLRDWSLNVEFFGEMLHQLRTESVYADIVNKLLVIPPKCDERHRKAVVRIATAYMKLLFPHITSIDMVDREEFYTYCIQPAMHRRDIIRQQCGKIDRQESFQRPMPDIRVKDL